MARVMYLALGATVLALATASVYALSGAGDPAALLATIRGEKNVAPGFIGTAAYGHWRLICVPGPAPLEGLDSDDSASARAQPLNACRVNLEMPAPDASPRTGGAKAAIIVAANFSLVGDRRTPALMVRFPPTATAGDSILLRFDHQDAWSISVRDCTDDECLAVSALTESQWRQAMMAARFEVIFPERSGRHVLIDLPTDGLPAAIAAMGRAQLSPSS